MHPAFPPSASNVLRSADSPLGDALTLMNNEGLSSVAVVDSTYNVVGNISTFNEVGGLRLSERCILLSELLCETLEQRRGTPGKFMRAFWGVAVAWTIYVVRCVEYCTGRAGVPIAECIRMSEAALLLLL